MPITLDGSKDEIARLVRHFATNLAQYRAPGYKEANARQEFIDPFFAALGWDVHNALRAAPDYREVVVEPSLDVEGHQKAPDYAFRIGREAKFYVEAKKPGVDLKVDPGPAYQLRRYAWTARLPLSVLTDFEEFAVYDCRKRPSDRDKPAVARTDFYTFEEYPDCWPKIWEVFSRDAVLGGAFDKAAGGAARRGASEVDAEFLKEIEGWRDVLARNFALRNPRLTVDELNDAVQKTIDRIVFLRMAEDRGMEEYGRLQRLADVGGTYTGLIRIARLADDKYNSGLFDFSRDKLTPHLSLDDKALAAILKSLYFPQSPYAFRVLPPEILGSVYERFLGKVIRLTAGHQAKVEEKPEVRKAGGVYYTPGYIVDYIVEQTVTKQIAGKSPAQLRGYRVLDMACGSGSFLVGAYRALLDHYLRWYSENEPERHAKAVYAVAIAGYDTSLPLSGGREGGGSSAVASPDPHPGPSRGRAYRLTTAEKKRILTEHIFGVDIDHQAVEVTKLSLLLQVLEGETDETLGKQMRLLHDRALPDLDRNIQCGNSLIGPDYFSGRLLPDAEELSRVNPFDWKAAFPEAMAAGGFDAVIGNPPYIRIQTLKEWAPLEVEAYKDLYTAAASGNYDIYVVFVERGLSLLNPRGRLGFIIPQKFWQVKYGEALRSILSQGRNVASAVNFSNNQVFEAAFINTCIIVLSKSPLGTLAYTEVPKVERDGSIAASLAAAEQSSLSSKIITSQPWVLKSAAKSNVLAKLASQGNPLGDCCTRVFQGLKTSADRVYVLRLIERSRGKVRAYSAQLDREVVLEDGLCHQLIKGTEMRRFVPLPAERVILFPYTSTGSGVGLVAERELRADYPRTYEYLKDNERVLRDRERGAMNHSGWYGFGRSQALDVVSCPKLLTPDLAPRSSFLLDPTGGYFILGGAAGGYGIIPKDDFSPLYLLGLLNCRAISFFITQSGQQMESGYFSFEARFIRSAPIHTIDFSDPADKARHDKMVALVERMLELHKRKQAAGSDHERQLLQRQIDSTDGEIDALVYELYGLTDEEIRIVEGSPSPQPSPLQGEGV